MNINKDYYQILELHKGANEEEIKKSFRRLAVKWHPDKNPDSKDLALERFQELSEAYETLSDSSKRNHYDNYGYTRNHSNYQSP